MCRIFIRELKKHHISFINGFLQNIITGSGRCERKLNGAHTRATNLQNKPTHPIHKKDLDKNEEGVGFCGSLEHIWDYVYCRSNIFPCLTLCNCDLWVS